MFIPDLHSFTTPVNHDELHDQIMLTAKLFAAAGLPFDNDSIFMYRQSYIPAHSELTWILDCFTGIGEMGRMTQFKDKSEGLGDERISVGLFNYPVLMAADILLYGAQYVSRWRRPNATPRIYARYLGDSMVDSVMCLLFLNLLKSSMNSLEKTKGSTLKILSIQPKK